MEFFFISSAISSRFLGLSFFESFKPKTKGLDFKITPPTVNGPASGPRPTSSSPKITLPGRAAIVFSKS